MKVGTGLATDVPRFFLCTKFRGYRGCRGYRGFRALGGLGFRGYKDILITSSIV